MTERALGWRPPVDRTHETTYAMRTIGVPSLPTPVVIGIPWYTNFDRPQRDPALMDVYWIGRGDLGSVRGGHCVCLRPPSRAEIVGTWQHYNQNSEGACVGFGSSRAAGIMNRRLYDGFALYHEAQKRDPWPGENYSGTSVNAGMQTLRQVGAWPIKNGAVTGPVLKDGIMSYSWAANADEVAKALHSTEGFVRILNSWGRGYPYEVRMSLETLDFLLGLEGEAAIPIDRPGQSKVRPSKDAKVADAATDSESSGLA